ncbi:voltage-gated potassium channel [Flexivirga endophytica]|uniref:Voltage-gated potassium channel n=2 Tax=Flexivirga endophytica TaxID=1849103 RepID=A0A916STL1_9MICO|nr:voltage-gated potassium channel [Flexivirga endophytica]
MSRWEFTLLLAAAAFLAAYAVPILDTGLAPAERHLCNAVEWLTWGLFVFDYVVEFRKSNNKRKWMIRHIVDFAALILPMLRPLRLLRIVPMLRVLNRMTVASLRGRVAAYIVATTFLVGFTASLTCLDVERYAPGSNIHTFGDSAWWTIATMTTVGYGDHYPVTTEGRFIGAALMISGIALLGTVTATLASWITEQVERDDDRLLSEIRSLRQDIAKLQRQQANSR